ncbi:MAG TPA: GAF domain-containing protein [Cyclobacteriaceae bacterium]|nr:GAF domain-containing protein [Cyclobacteriaceae bacterium]
MIKDLKDSGKINILLTLLFVIGIAVSAYFLFRLPNNLMIPYGYESVFNTVFAVVGITLLIGVIALVQAMRYKKELIVYRDRVTETNQGGQDAAGSANSINVDNIKTALSSAQNEKDTLQLGLQSICKQLDAGQGAIYRVEQENNTRFVELKAGYALSINENTTVRYNFGEGLIGQAASNAQLLYLDEVPDGYIKIISGLGSASPRYLIIAPVKKGETVLGILEIASFSPYSADQRNFVEQGAQLIAEKLSTK